MTEEKRSHEIDIIKIAFQVLKQWRYLLKFVAVGTVFGLLIALSTYRKYQSSVVLAPEFSSGTGGLSGGLADLAESFGVSSGGTRSMDAIYPDLYPDIFMSTEFIQSLYDVPVRLEKDPKQRTYLQHLLHDVKNPWWNMPRIWINNLMKPKNSINDKGQKDAYTISRDEWGFIMSIQADISCIVDKKTSVITISVEDQDPMVAAIMADTLQHRLQEYVTNYRTAKARVDVEHYKKLTFDAKEKYERARRLYASSSDANTEIILQSVNSKIEDLENDMQLKYNVYTQCLTQLKTAEAKLQERTPAFTIIQPAKTNPKAVSTPKIVILLLWVAISCVIGSIVIIYKDYRKNAKNNN